MSVLFRRDLSLVMLPGIFMGLSPMSVLFFDDMWTGATVCSTFVASFVIQSVTVGENPIGFSPRIEF